MPVGFDRKTDVTIEKLIEYVRVHFSQDDLDLVKRAIAFAQKHYGHIIHPVGKPYVEFAIEIGLKLCDLSADPLIISAAISYPPPPAKSVLDHLRNFFKDKSKLVSLVEEIDCLERLEWNTWSLAPEQNESKEAREQREILQKMFLLAIDEGDSQEQDQASLKALHFQKREKQVENLVRMFLASVGNMEALIYKLVERLHFIKLLKDLPSPQRETIYALQHAKITLAIYAPLADRLGLWRIKSELEDMAFRLIQPMKYKAIARQLEATKDERRQQIDKIVPIIYKQIKGFGLEAEISGRAKHIYSIYQKMEAKLLDIEEINDLLGIRIIVGTIDDCYNVQGILHEYWSPVTDVYEGKAGRDWIAHPKKNQYQSLHTTINIDNKVIEVQIRTRAMHEIAEYGAASAHWRYKQLKAYRKGKALGITRPKDQLWSEQLAELRKSLDNELPPTPQAKKQQLKDWIYVITPEGHVIDLPAGATPIDFAYRIHTDLGNRYTGAKIRDHLVQLDYKLKNGDVVELITSRARKGPSREWLARSRDEEGKSNYVFVRTRQARGKIRHWLKEQEQK